ncbi:MAG: hypothetical protein K0R61_1530 [Microvirga sp.]|jgi:hypothetical protein|nr:hypothetical protein [Microvirga sp.]
MTPASGSARNRRRKPRPPSPYRGRGPGCGRSDRAAQGRRYARPRPEPKECRPEPHPRSFRRLGNAQATRRGTNTAASPLAALGRAGAFGPWPRRKRRLRVVRWPPLTSGLRASGLCHLRTLCDALERENDGSLGATNQPRSAQVTWRASFRTSRRPRNSGGIFGRRGNDDFGWALGGGVEWAFTNNLTLKVEGLWVNFDGGDNGRGCCVAVQVVDVTNTGAPITSTNTTTGFGGRDRQTCSSPVCRPEL